jgi:hypothetical protein
VEKLGMRSRIEETIKVASIVEDPDILGSHWISGKSRVEIDLQHLTVLIDPGIAAHTGKCTPGWLKPRRATTWCIR